MCFRRRLLKALCISLCLAALVGCSGKATKPETKAGPHAGLISGTPEEVRKKLGEPSEVSRTPENHILWVYRPSWQIMPGNSDTFVVQFDNGRVAKVFKLD